MPTYSTMYFLHGVSILPIFGVSIRPLDTCKNYIALLDIKAIIRKWQDLDLSDDHALIEIREILERLTK